MKAKTVVLSIAGVLILTCSVEGYGQKKPPKKPTVAQNTPQITITTSPGDVFAVREWTDTTGARKVKAALKNVEGPNVLFLKDGKEFTLPIDRLSEPDQKIIKGIGYDAALKQLDDDIKDFRRKVDAFDGTELQRTKFRESLLPQLEKDYQGVRVRIVLQVTNVSFLPNKPGADMGQLGLDTGHSVERLSEVQVAPNRKRGGFNFPFSEKEALTVNKNPKLILVGTITFRYAKSDSAILLNSMGLYGVYLDNLSYEIENAPPKAANVKEQPPDGPF